jgi:hypothetical protein
MVLAADYPFLDILWTMLIFFVWVSWFWLVIKITIDIFRRRDIHGGKKTLWILFVLFFPLLGVIVYLITNGDHMARRDVEDLQARQAQFDDHVRSVASTGGAAAEIDRAKKLLDSGAINAAEYEALKAKALA